MKSRVWKKIAGIGLVGALAFSLTACQSTSASAKKDLKGLKEKGTITVGMMAATPPYEYHLVENGKDKIVGSDIKLLDKVTKDLGVKYEIKDMDFDGLLVALQSGKIDMIISAISPTEEREKNADFTNVYYKGRNVMLVRKEDVNKYKTGQDFADKKLATIKTSVQETIVEKELPNAQLKLLGKSTDLALDLAANKVDGVLVDIPTAILLSRGNPKITLSKVYYEDPSVGAAIAMPNGTDKEVMAQINKTIAKYKPEYEQWLKDATKNVK
ncbi:transporter substrate-binding domain-containing protein [Neobacillus vireti]|uniref:transporter substrate-binding domain-containing protein n=1 Tax=Neobacillus vireti TaxID=220686 RepID=UPI002FFF8005